MQPPDLEEMRPVIKNLKDNKGKGSDTIVAEVIKYGGTMLEEKIQKLIEKVWNEEKIPDPPTLPSHAAAVILGTGNLVVAGRHAWTGPKTAPTRNLAVGHSPSSCGRKKTGLSVKAAPTRNLAVTGQRA
ncbi:hypothetical protein ILUMI_10346 [Ignelater luminosus]|uniref:Uncharacterized protein n=1 Tax=Ignelater luminosus TaxID=2038154 RepID=A0A8K0CYA6_IGNLU|nr:hypothetical protein ILUMI_10346 [Ignelater luminosus]